MANNHFITREHPDYAQNRQVRLIYRDLYSGGERFRQNAASYLVRRHKEPSDVYYERLSRVFYENYIGSIVDWYTATLFRREPVIQFEGPNEHAKLFFNDFIGNCDRQGTTLSEFYRRAVTNALVDGTAYIGVDFPRKDTPAINRAQEDAAGHSRAYLSEYTAEDVINWCHDHEGSLEWIVIRTSNFSLDDISDQKWIRKTRWIYYDRNTFEIYEGAGDSNSAAPELIAKGNHALAGQNRVPVFEIGVSDGLWLLNKAGQLQLEHFNKSNALSWALTMGLFATPVIYSDREFSQIVGESYFIQLSPQDRFGWTEPEGNVYQIAADNLVRLKNEIYRICYLSNQVSGSMDSRPHQSGLSKAWDFSITQEILRTYGDMVKDSMRAVLTAIGVARQDELVFDISGLDEFDIQDFAGELADAQTLLAMGIPSETFKRQLFKRIALKYFCDARQEVKTQIAEEIDRALEKPVSGS